jgi:hypothetical protein
MFGKMNDTPSDWKISLLRWLAWVVLCLGMATEMFIVFDAGSAVVSRVLAEQVIWQEDTGQSPDILQAERSGQFSISALICPIALIAVSLAVALDYYLRAGVKKGCLFRRIGVAAGIEVGVYVLATLIEVFV